MPKSCDTMVALPRTTQHQQMIFAKNSNRPASEYQPLVQHARRAYIDGAITECQFVQLPQPQAIYRHIGSRLYWCWGYEHGFSELWLRQFQP